MNLIAYQNTTFRQNIVATSNWNCFRTGPKSSTSSPKFSGSTEDVFCCFFRRHSKLSIFIFLTFAHTLWCLLRPCLFLKLSWQELQVKAIKTKRMSNQTHQSLMRDVMKRWRSAKWMLMQESSTSWAHHCDTVTWLQNFRRMCCAHIHFNSLSNHNILTFHLTTFPLPPSQLSW